MDGVGDWGGGFGPRFHYNLNGHFALDSELTYRQHNVSTFNSLIPTSTVIGQTTGLFGVRTGQRVQDFGLFVQARAGFLHFGTNQGVSLLTRNTVPAFNVGGVIERSSGPVVLHLDLGEMIVAYGNAQATAAARSPWHTRESHGGFWLCRPLLNPEGDAAVLLRT